MVRAVEKVDERLRRAMDALTASSIIAAMIGAKAVAYWVSRLDEGAVRNTPNVDLLIDRSDAERARAAIEKAGFVRTGSGQSPMIFLDGPDGSLRQAVRLWLSGDKPSPNAEPLPKLIYSLPAFPHRVVALPTLVRMKLSAFRTIDCVHLQDMVRVGLIDQTWPDQFPHELAERLRQILADPDG